MLTRIGGNTVDRNKLVEILASCDSKDTETELHDTLRHAFSVTDEQMLAALGKTAEATPATGSACC